MRETFKHFAPDFLMHYEKGGGGQAAMMMMMMQQQNAAEERRRQEDKLAREDMQIAADRKEEKAAEELQNKKSQSVQRIGRAYDTSLSDADTRLRSKGLQSGMGFGAGGQSGPGIEVMNLYRAALDKARASAPEVVDDANSLFSSSLFDNAYNSVRDTYRGKYQNELDAFLGDGFDKTTFADTMDDEILNSVLGRQKTEAQERLEQAKGRGQINDAGFSRGLKDLEDMFKVGQSKAQGLGGGVLSNYRKEALDFANQQKSRLTNYDLGDKFNVGGVRNQFDSLVNSKKSSLEGDILAALDGTSFFDTDKLLGRATGASGVMNQGGSDGGLGIPLATGVQPNSLLAPLQQSKQTNSVDDDKQQNTVF